jgi:Transposase DDE domain group 1
VQATNTRPRFEVSGDGDGIVGHAGAVVLAELSDRLGLTGELGRHANRGLRVGAHDRGQVLRDLAVMLADGGDCLSDLRALREQPELFGEVASVPTAWRVLVEEVAGDPRGIAAVWSALARTRQRAWALGAAPAGPLVIDLDATLIAAHSDKQGAAPTYQQGFGFHPCWRSWTAAMGPGRRWLRSCGKATPGPTPPPITWPCSAWRWPPWPSLTKTSRS